MVNDEYIAFPIDDDGHLAHVKVSAIHTVADTMDAQLSSVYTVGGAFTVALPTDEVLRLLDEWCTAKMQRMN